MTTKLTIHSLGRIYSPMTLTPGLHSTYSMNTGGQLNKVTKTIFLTVLLLSTTQAHAGKWGRLTKKVKREAKRLVSQVQGAVARIVTETGITNCDKRNIEGIHTYCFNIEEQRKIELAINTIKKHPYIVEHRVGKINSLHFVQGHTKQIINLE